MKNIVYGGNMKQAVFNAFNELEIADNLRASAKVDFESGTISEAERDAALADIKEQHKDDWTNFKTALSFTATTSEGFTVRLNAVDLLNDALEKGAVEQPIIAMIMSIITDKSAEESARYSEHFASFLALQYGANVRSGFAVKRNKKAGTVAVVMRDMLRVKTLKGKGAKIIRALIHDALMAASEKTDKVRFTDAGWILPDGMIQTAKRAK